MVIDHFFGIRFRIQLYDPHGSLTNWDYYNDYEP